MQAAGQDAGVTLADLPAEHVGCSDEERTELFYVAVPDDVAGEEIAPSVRMFHLADVEVFHGSATTGATTFSY